MALWSPCTASGGRQQQLLVSGISLVKRLQEVGQFHQKGQRHLPRHTFKATHTHSGAHLLQHWNDGAGGQEGGVETAYIQETASQENKRSRSLPAATPTAWMRLCEGSWLSQQSPQSMCASRCSWPSTPERGWLPWHGMEALDQGSSHLETGANRVRGRNRHIQNALT